MAVRIVLAVSIADIIIVVLFSEVYQTETLAHTHLQISYTHFFVQELI